MHDVGDDVVLTSTFCFAVQRVVEVDDDPDEAMEEAVGDSRGR